MSIFAISDLHLSFGTDKPMDIFGARWEHFEERLRENWLKKITPEDTVVLPGDLSWGMTVDEARADFAFLHALPGQKILLKGNHDYYWSTQAKLSSFLDDAGFDSIRFLHNNAYLCEGLILAGSRGWVYDEPMKEADRKILARELSRFELSLQAAAALQKTHPEHEIVLFSHYPLSCLSARHPALDLLCEYGVRRVYYGHLHQVRDGLLPPKEEDGVCFHLISADYLDFDPVQIF